MKYMRVIVPDEIHENYPGKNIYRINPKFSDRSYGQTVQTDISLLLYESVLLGSAQLPLCLHIVVEPQ